MRIYDTCFMIFNHVLSCSSKCIACSIGLYYTIGLIDDLLKIRWHRLFECGCSLHYTKQGDNLIACSLGCHNRVLGIWYGTLVYLWLQSFCSHLPWLAETTSSRDVSGIMPQECKNFMPLSRLQVVWDVPLWIISSVEG